MKQLFFLGTILLTAMGSYHLGTMKTPPQTETYLTETRGGEEDGYKLKYLNLRDKFHRINEIDLNEYLELKDQKAKYEKADEVLGKILMIFLADLGLRVSSEKVQFAKKAIYHKKNRFEEVKKKTSPQKIVLKEKDIVSRDAIENNWRKNEANLDNIRSKYEADEFLKSVVIDDFFGELKKAQVIKKEQLQTLNGLFLGKVIFDGKTQLTWDVEMELEGHIEEGVLKGNSIIKLSKEGKTFSRSRGKGELKDFRAFSGNPEAILINAYGDDGFFQLYMPRQSNALIGNYYHRESVDVFKKTGTVSLKKR